MPGSEWLVPWRGADPVAAARLEAELSREITSRHMPFGESARLLATRADGDDALFGLADGRVAEVHLTWSGETDPRWPDTTMFSSLEEWRDQRMHPLHRDWSNHQALS